jgi:hypothetical protein
MDTKYGGKLCDTHGCLTNVSVSVQLCNACTLKDLTSQLAEAQGDHAEMFASHMAMEGIVMQAEESNRVLREALESIEKDDYLWPSHREGADYTPAEFAHDVMSGKARLWSDKKALAED